MCFFTVFKLLFKLNKTPILPILNIIFVLISSILLIFLCLACRKPGSAFSQIYTIQTTPKSDGDAILRAGYFYMCEVHNNSTICARNGEFKGTDVAYQFAKHVSRPYFLVIATCIALIAFITTILSMVMPRLLIKQLNFLITALAAFFTIITACWQQIAVHAAVILIPSDVKRGKRAGGMVWSAVAMLSISTILVLLSHVKHRKEELKSAGSDNSSYRSDIKDPFAG